MAVFEQKAVPLMEALLAAFPVWSEEDAAAVAGNGGHESGGFQKLQEIKPVVPGSRGGYGWFQWTGPRRRQFESFCKRMKLAPSSDEANTRFIIHELREGERAAVNKTKTARGLEAKVKAFEAAYERAGVKHYASRLKYANRAMAAWKKAHPVRHFANINESPPIDDAEVVKMVQEHLLLLGYTEVGPADGNVGPMTKAAILAYRADNGLPMVGFIDQDMIDSFGEAKRRELVPERRNAKIAKIASEVPEVKAHWWNKWLAGGSAGTAAVAGAADYIAPATGAVASLKDTLAEVPGWVWFLVVAVIAFAMYKVATGGMKAGEEAYRTGERR